MVSVDTNRLCSMLYFVVISYFGNVHGINNYKWIENVRQILTLIGFSGILDTHGFPNRLWLAKVVKQKLTDIFFNEWKLEIETRTAAYTYR